MIKIEIKIYQLFIQKCKLQILLSLKIESSRRESTHSFILFAQGNEQILILILIMILILFFFNFSEFELLCPSSMTKRLMSNQLDRASTSIALNLDLAVGSGKQHQPFDPESLVARSSTCTGMSALATNLAASDSESKSWHSLPFRTAESRIIEAKLQSFFLFSSNVFHPS